MICHKAKTNQTKQYTVKLFTKSMTWTNYIKAKIDKKQENGKCRL